MAHRGHIGTLRQWSAILCAWGCLAALITSTLPLIADAASFSCTAPTAPRESLICADPELSRADEILAGAYKGALAALSESGREAIREGQRQWLRYTQTVCGIGRKAPADRPSGDCLKDEYAARQKQLDSAAVKKDGLVIRRVDTFKATPSASPASGGGHAGFNTTAISYPQIDRPRDEREEAWNKLALDHSRPGEAVAGASSDPAEDHDLTVDYVLGTVSPTLISLQLFIYDDWHGAHGSGADEQITWLIREGRALAAEDVFHGKRGWDEALAQLASIRRRKTRRRAATSFPSRSRRSWRVR